MTFTNQSFVFSSQFYVSVAPQNSVKISQVIQECIVAKRVANRSPRYVDGLDDYLRLFARGREGREISTFNVSDIEAWFAGRTEKTVTRASNLGRLSALFSFAVRRNYIAENPCNRMERIHVDREPPKIFAPETVERMLEYCQSFAPEMLPWLALGAFAGVRPEELLHLTWGDLDLVRGKLVVSKSKIRRRRIVDLSENCVAWLRICDQHRPLVPKKETVRRRRRAMCRKLGLVWLQDELRHTAASFMLARDNDAGKVSLRLGNSPRILLEHYAETVSAKACARYWQIVPK